MSSVSIHPPVAAERRLDRSLYVFMAALFIAVAAVGFGPRSVAILTGELRNPPLAVHVHAVLMASWLLLFLAQTSLMANGRKDLHRSLGRIAFVLAPAVFAMLVLLTIGGYGQVVAFASDAANPQPPEVLAKGMAFIVFVLGRAAVLFGIFCGWAVLARRGSPETHKRMMVMATLVVIDAGLGRIGGYGWLPGGSVDIYAPGSSYNAVHAYQVALLAPALLFDIVRFGRIHRAYVIGLGLLLPFMLALHFLWDSPWWQQTVLGFLGGSG